MFFLRTSTIHVDCFTHHHVVYDNFKIDKAIKFYPEEVKHIPNKVQVKVSDHPNSKLIDEFRTIKQCDGLRDLYKHGFMLPAWCDMTFEMFDENKYNVANYNPDFKFGFHPRELYGTELFKGYSHIKLLSPWLASEKTGVDFSWNPITWGGTHNLTNATILSGVINYRDTRGTDINVFIKNGSIVKYVAGEPLVHIIPISDKKVKLHHHLISKDEYNYINDYTGQRLRYTNWKRLKTPQMPSTSKCPFGFK
jgi:hypothetical protein